MTNVLVILAEAMLIVVTIGIATLLAVWLFGLHGRRVAASVRDDAPSRVVADTMIRPPKPREPILPDDFTDRQVDRLARHLDLRIVEPTHAGSVRGPAAPRDEKAAHTAPAEPVVLSPIPGHGSAGAHEAASHATKGRR